MNPAPSPTSSRRAELALLLVAVFWGLTFPAIRSAVATVPPLDFVAWRFSLATLVFLPLVLARPAARRDLLRAAPLGLVLGFIAWISYITQTIGLQTVSAGRGAFITGLNVVFVPLFAPLFRQGRPGRLDLITTGLAVLGLLVMTRPDLDGLAAGDLWVLVCAVAYALYIHALQRGSGRVDPGALAFTQVAGVGLFALVVLPLGEPAPFPSWEAWVAIAFCGVFATVATFWLQTRFQGDTTPTRAALIFTSEPVFAAFFAWLLIGETLGLRELAGAAMILGAVLIVELAPRGAAPVGQGEEGS